MSEYDGRIVYRVEADTSGVDDAINQTKRSFKQSGDSITGVFKNIATTLGGLKIVQILKNYATGAVSLASDLAEVQNVVDVTFGDGAATIEAWAKNAGLQFGLTEIQAKNFTSTLGAMMKSAGLSGDQIVDMSTDLAGLAADMASFYNMDFETAFNKIRSGISGITMPLQQLGINMSETNLQAFALTKGITKSFDKMTQGEKTLLRYQYLMSVTADAQGDFARTSDGLANSSRQLETNLNTIQANIGKFLKPAVEDATRLLAELTTALVFGDGKKTVLDTIAEIDLNTETKIHQIETTAEKARTLVGILEDIDKLNSPQTALTNMAEGAEKLNSTDVKPWSDLESAVSGIDDTDGSGAVGDISRDAGDLDAGEWTELSTAVGEIEGSATQNKAGDIARDATGITVTDAQNWISIKDVVLGLEGSSSQNKPKDIVGDVVTLQTHEINDWRDLGEIVAGLEGSATQNKADDIVSSAGELTDGTTTKWSNLSGSVTDISGTGTKAGAVDAIKNKANLLKDVSNWTTLKQSVRSIIDAKTPAEGNVMSDIEQTAGQLSEDEVKPWKELTESLEKIKQSNGNGSKVDTPKVDAGQTQEMQRLMTIAERLGITFDGATGAQDLYIATCKQLVQVLPELNGIINTETGEIQGGTQALYDHITAWEKAQKAQVYWDAHRRKGEAINKEYQDVVQEEVTLERLRRERDELARAYEELGGDEKYNADKNQTRGSTYGDRGYSQADKIFNMSEIAKKHDELEKLDNQIKEKDESLAERSAARKKAYDEWEKEGEIIEELYGKENALTDAEYANAAATETMTEKIKAAEDALKSVGDYIDKTREDTRRALDSVADGFEAIDSPAEKARQKVSDLKAELARTSDQAKRKEIETQIKNAESSAEEAVKSVQQMNKGLEDQIKYYDEYERRMQKAREMGYSEEVLAALSDGSTESYDYLEALLGASEPEIQKLNENYEKLGKSKDTLADTLAQQKLLVDKTFEELVNAAEQAVKDLDQESAAETAVEKTVQGIADGINAKYPEVKSAVDKVLAEVGRLSGLSFSFNLGSPSGFMQSTSKGGVTFTPLAIGMDYVPFDGFLASLHEGEGVLTAEENRAWQAFKNGGASTANSIDYGRLSGAIWDNAPSMGGNVYLDGQTVGRVISSQQADSLRTLTRSGWQG